MQIRYFQKGFNYSQDGPGNRLVLHLCGCNMRCSWCSNPEGMDGAAGRGEDVEALAAWAISARAMFFDGGGVTLTGGEATLQFAAVKELLGLLRGAGVDTCIETNGTHPQLPELFPLLDLLICDLKHPDDAAHRLWTGAGNGIVKRNIRAASGYGSPVWIRVPLIHGVNDADADLEGFLSFFSSVSRPGLSVEFLRYHEYGRDKWTKLGREYAMRDAFLPEGRAELFENACREAGIDVIRT